MRAYAFAALLLTAFALAGCAASDDDPRDGGATGTGSASAYVKDAPADHFREVHVVFTEVAVHRSGGDTTNTTGTSTSTNTTTSAGNTTVGVGVGANGSVSQESGWIVLFSDLLGEDIDLLNTTGSRAAFLGEADLAAGQYQQVRITVKEAYGIDHNGTRVPITVSSGTLKVVRGFTVEDSEETRIVLDIDLEKSLKQQGNGQWRMTPVVGKATATQVDDASSGEDASQPGDIESVPEAS